MRFYAAIVCVMSVTVQACAQYALADLAHRDAPAVFKMSLKEAEAKALDNSDKLKSLHETTNAAIEKSRAQFGRLLPQLNVSGYYQYDTYVPDVSLGVPNMPAIQFGSHNNYAAGPTLSYTLWDTGAERDAYRAAKLLAESNKEQELNARVQALFSVRASYSRLQLALEELNLLNSSLNLAKAQNHDIETNFRAGAASRLDLVDSRREVISYQLQFKQAQSEVESDFEDLLNLVQVQAPINYDRPGLSGLPETNLVLKLDSLANSLAAVNRWPLNPPDDDQPELQSLSNLAQSSDEQAKSEWARLFPKLDVSASAMIQYPNEIVLQTIEQNAFTATLTMPLFDGNQTRHLVDSTRSDADSARFQREQAKRDLMTDFEKAMRELNNLKEQQRLATLDMQSSESAAKLYYRSYKAGKINLIDVQGANNRELMAKVNAARIDAQTLNEIYLIESISGRDTL